MLNLKFDVIIFSHRYIMVVEKEDYFILNQQQLYIYKKNPPKNRNNTHTQRKQPPKTPTNYLTCKHTCTCIIILI